MSGRLKTIKIKADKQIKTFFNEQALNFSEQHGNSKKLFIYRIKLLAEWGRFKKNDIVLDIGCGVGHHLIALADRFTKGIGIDFSPEMIKEARKRLQNSPLQNHISFYVDDAEEITKIENHSTDIVICIGALEHMRNRQRVFTMVNRVLKNNGRFVCLTPNGSYFWYRTMAPLFGVDTRHLSTDYFLDSNEVKELLRSTGFQHSKIGYWTFIPKGDMHPLMGLSLQMFDWFGRLFKISSLRGGLVFLAKLNRNYD
ncbi:MAG: class I SAM-dependent methyltransferase [Candidatus Marinimicrobia bacterium]|nr:class I SAM-dependent methyltransferase [Candidatus Neomarinimicrobiota bacterium]